jgi:hypothetical protein
MEQVVDTMLHELSHNVFGPHNADFHALWDQLRKEYEGLLSKGYTGEGFLSDGHRLGGGGRVPLHEARRIAKAAAEKRRVLSSGSGQKLGGRPLPVGTDIRRVIVAAIERRSTVLKGCGSEKVSDKEIDALANQATQNGFSTKGDEDEANDRAIAQALWELVQEDEKREYGEMYIPPTASNPTGNGGGEIGSMSPERKRIKKEDTSPVPIRNKADTPPIRQNPNRPPSRLVLEAEKKKPKIVRPKRTEISPVASSSRPVVSKDPSPEPHMEGWTCSICTLHNPITFLACDACTSERPVEITNQLAKMKSKPGSSSRPNGVQSEVWTCPKCSTIMGNKWWTCSMCGKMKESS